MRCLIVDDSAAFLDAARTILERDGLTIVGVASSSVEALRCAAELGPDVVLVDVDLGGESGFELAERLHHSHAKFPVVLISTHDEQDLREMIDASPALGFVPKLALSGRAIRHLMGIGDTAAGSVSETRGK